MHWPMRECREFCVLAGGVTGSRDRHGSRHGICLGSPDKRGDGILAKSKVAGNPAIAAPLGDERHYSRGEALHSDAP